MDGRRLKYGGGCKVWGRGCKGRFLTLGSVMAKHERISPLSRGFSHRSYKDMGRRTVIEEIPYPTRKSDTKRALISAHKNLLPLGTISHKNFHVACVRCTAVEHLEGR